jgi:alanine racemase
VAEEASTLAAVTSSLNASIVIDLDALDANVRALRRAIGPGVELVAVVKANAYGHGAAAVGPALEAAGVDRFAVISVAEAVALRRTGVALPVLVLGHSFPADTLTVIENDITITCHSVKLGRALSEGAAARGTSARVHVKVDTGLHRFGLEAESAIALAEEIRTLPGIEVEGLYTHFANADADDDSFSETQAERFAAVVRRLDWIPFRHAGNSATALRRPGLRFDGVRCGLALYGVVPPATADPGLVPALSLTARLARVSTIEPGEGVSYGLTWRAERPGRIALVPVGYADGWFRHLSGRGAVLVGGRRCPILGRVAMDQFIVDVTGVPGAAEGDEAVLIGRQGSDAITADEVATLAGTISWDVLASLQARLPRLYHRGGLVQRIIGG